MALAVIEGDGVHLVITGQGLDQAGGAVLTTTEYHDGFFSRIILLWAVQLRRPWAKSCHCRFKWVKRVISGAKRSGSLSHWDNRW